MPHPAFERAVALPAELFGQVFEICDCADMKDRGEPALLLLLCGSAGGYGLDRHAVCLADFEMVARQFIVGPN